MIKKISFESDGLKLIGNLHTHDGSGSVGVLFLHGGGIGSKERYKDIQIRLDKNYQNTLSFDFRGVGESEGVFEESTLNGRLNDAMAAYDFLAQYVDRVVILGTSMGAYVAIKLSEMRDVSGLILLYGAAYSAEADDKLFNSELSKVLREKDSWKSSPAFSILRKFIYPVLVMYGGRDMVIPKAVQQSFEECLKKSDQFIVLEDASHIMLKATNKKEAEEKKIILHKIDEFLENV